MLNRNNHVPHDTEDKNWWCQHGEKLEGQFVTLCRDHLDLNAVINPEKASNRFALDLIVEDKIADLKTQNTPFFTAHRYRMDPRYTFTFNRKDYHSYKSKAPECDIYVWVDWKQLEGYGAKVDYFGGIFRLPFIEVAKMIDAGAPEHYYKRRQSEFDRNAKSSFLLDIRKFEALFVSDGAFSLPPTGTSQARTFL